MRTLATSTLFWLLWFSSHICLKCEERNFRIKMDEFSVKYKVRDLIQHIDFRIVNLNNRSYVNGEMIVKSDVEDIIMHTSMDFWKRSNQKKIKLYDGRLDACQFLKTSHRNGLFKIYVKSFKKHVHGNLTCPLRMNFNYTLTNWHMDEKDLPPFVPLGKFRTVTEYFTQERLALRIVTQGKVLSYRTN
ncbi:uncharacterized protein LOC6527523 [Drosophila yakuba]|uniref:Uncharacterized protein n=1 Tax=Drosophila yakuba TaxID=7245 RepID=B4P383_DROYA|nr:uncharacterized protein LOC6527523 [Drosophila yakuba]EDW88325.1 uncharacterized protein Dyak_GE18665 [Drosophila yakuba]